LEKELSKQRSEDHQAMVNAVLLEFCKGGSDKTKELEELSLANQRTRALAKKYKNELRSSTEQFRRRELEMISKIREQKKIIEDIERRRRDNAALIRTTRRETRNLDENIRLLARRRGQI
jgi:hypothetical protein